MRISERTESQLKGQNGSNSTEVGLAYIRGRIETQAEIAAAINVLQTELIARMATVFSDAEAIWPVLGNSNHLPNLRGTPAARTGPRVALAVDAGSPGKTTRQDSPNQPLNKSGNLRGMNQESRKALALPAATTKPATPHPLKGRPLSPKAYKNIVKGIKRRQAANAAKKALENGTKPPAKPARPKPKFTKAGLERLRQAAKRRWAEKKKLGLPGSSLPSKPK